MQSREIPEDQWIHFFDDFSRDHSGWTTSIELMSKETGPQHLARGLPLRGISFDAAAGTRPCTIQIGAGDSPSANLSHVIDLPLHIRVADDDDGSAGTIQIEPARGAVTLVHYHRPDA